MASHLNLKFLLALNLGALEALGLYGKGGATRGPDARLSLMSGMTLMQLLSLSSLLGSIV